MIEGSFQNFILILIGTGATVMVIVAAYSFIASQSKPKEKLE